LLVVRHGRTEWNATGRFQGMGDPPLDQVGEHQAAALAVELAPMRPSAVVSSDLRRARCTAAAVAAATGLDVEVDAGLREVDLGTWEGLTRDEAEAAYPDEYRRWRDGEDIRRGGGETVAEAGSRAAAALLGLAGRAAPGDGPMVVVTHGIVLQAALDALHRDGSMAAPDLSAGAPHLGNAEWMAVELTGDPPRNRHQTGTIRK
jgi:glucosyl-3-phosphoglycerate phosphatase